MSLQEVTIHGDFKNIPENFLEQIQAFFERNYDVELIGIGRSPWNPESNES